MNFWRMFHYPKRGRVLNRTHAKHTYPLRKLSKDRSISLKHRIRYRLATEDYTCRLPKVPKPRVRYKLTKYWYGLHNPVLVYA